MMEFSVIGQIFHKFYAKRPYGVTQSGLFQEKKICQKWETEKQRAHP